MKPYNSLSDHLKQKLGAKTVKLSVNAGFSCPNRDGKISHGGCIFCSGSARETLRPQRIYPSQNSLKYQGKNIKQMA